MGKLSRKRKSGNPRGRPSRAHNRAARAECALKARKARSINRALLRRIDKTLERLKNPRGTTWSLERSHEGYGFRQ
jgi:hypothetical protein